MLFISFLIFLVFGKIVHSQSWNTSDGILPWESYLELGDIQRPLGLTLNRSSLAHRHFAIGYLCLHSFMYDEAQEAFNLAIKINNTFIEAYIGKMLACKQAFWSYTDFTCGQGIYNDTQLMLNTSNRTFSHLQLSLLSTVYKWYANKSNIEAGESAFLLSIAILSQTYPNETDVRVLWGLSLLNVADQTQYQTIMEPDKMIEARYVLKTALGNEPNHPGALHYLIHAYDVVQVNISQQAEGYASLYGTIVKTSSHAQHMPSHIWMRTGSWSRALSADGAGIITSLTLCATKLLGRNVSISSTQLEPVLNLFNTTDQKSFFLDCDAENRAHSTEWLSYTRLQTGNWLGSVGLLRDLFIADNQSILTPDHYLSFAYRTQARTIIDLFFWFSYNYQFLNKTQQLITFYGTKTLIPVKDNVTRWYPIWSEAGFRLSECLRLLTADNISNNTSIVNDHLNRLVILSNRTSSINQYISISISLMISQIRGIRYYINGSWQECLNELNNAVQREATLVLDASSPTLIFARSSELLAMHLLLIHTKYKEQTGKILSPTYTLNGTNVTIQEFPTRALVLYQKANSFSPNRSINTLGMARSNLQLGNNSEAVRLYQVLLTQMSSSTDSDPIFSQEALNITVLYSSTTISTITTITASNKNSTATTISTTTTTTSNKNSTATTITGNKNTTITGNKNSATTNKHFFLSSILIFCVFSY